MKLTKNLKPEEFRLDEGKAFLRVEYLGAVKDSYTWRDKNLGAKAGSVQDISVLMVGENPARTEHRGRAEYRWPGPSAGKVMNQAQSPSKLSPGSRRRRNQGKPNHPTGGCIQGPGLGCRVILLQYCLGSCDSPKAEMQWCLGLCARVSGGPRWSC